MERARAALAALKTGSAPASSVYRAACEDMTTHLGTTRASVWSLESAGFSSSITSLCLLDTRDGTCTAGAILRDADFPAYFDALTRDRRIIAADAAAHPATAGFDAVYLAPLDIRSQLDLVILEQGRPVAVLCCEQCAVQKPWTQQDLEYLQAIATIIGYTLRMAARTTV